jgi:hypothetical protein
MRTRMTQIDRRLDGLVSSSSVNISKHRKDVSHRRCRIKQAGGRGAALGQHPRQNKQQLKLNACAVSSNTDEFRPSYAGRREVRCGKQKS